MKAALWCCASTYLSNYPLIAMVAPFDEAFFAAFQLIVQPLTVIFPRVLFFLALAVTAKFQSLFISRNRALLYFPAHLALSCFLSQFLQI